MITSSQNRATTSKLLAIAFLLATLLTTLLATISAGAAVTSAKAYSWGANYHGELGNDTSGTISDAPVAVKNLTDVRNMDGGDYFTLATAE